MKDSRRNPCPIVNWHGEDLSAKTSKRLPLYRPPLWRSDVGVQQKVHSPSSRNCAAFPSFWIERTRHARSIVDACWKRGKRKFRHPSQFCEESGKAGAAAPPQPPDGRFIDRNYEVVPLLNARRNAWTAQFTCDASTSVSQQRVVTVLTPLIWPTCDASTSLSQQRVLTPLFWPVST